VVWRRDDLIGIQTVDLSAGFPASVFVTLEAPDYRLDEPGVVSGVTELDAETGHTKWLSQNGDWLFLHPTTPVILIQDRSEELVRVLDLQKREIGSTPMENFAILDVAFSEEMIALAEGAKGVRIIDLSGRMISRYAPKARKPNCIRINFDREHVNIFDSWEASFVSIIDPLSGRLIREYHRATRENICFIDDGSRFVDGSGEIYRSSDGEPVATLETEPKD
jgi:hypothetical protein